jgi:hypothetical protein
MRDWSGTIPNVKPLAGNCNHRWEDQESAYLVAQVCEFCKLYRYKPGLRADWEYRAPIPRIPLEVEQS